MARRRHHIVRNVILIIVLAVVVCAAVLGVGAAHVYTQSLEARTQYVTLSQEISSGDVDGAKTTTSELKASIGEIVSELDSPLWTIAGKLPVLGTEVSTARALASTASTLVNDAISPVVEDMSTLQNDGAIDSAGEVSVSGLLSNPVDTTSMLSSISSAESIVSACQETVSALPASQIPQLESAREEMTSGLTSTDTTLGEYSSQLEAVSQATSSLSSLVSSATGA